MVRAMNPHSSRPGVPSSCLNRLRVGAFPMLALVLEGCAATPTGPPLPPSKAKPLKVKKKSAPPKEESVDRELLGPRLPWAAHSFSPRPGSIPEPELEAAAAHCGMGDAALHEVAQVIAEKHQADGVPPDLDFATFHLRRLGSPYVMPRLWSAQLSLVDEQGIAESIDSWSSALTPLGEFRCGGALVEAEDGSFFVSFLQVDALADLLPLPTQVQSGDWLEFSARFLQPTSDATLLLLPPEGPPRRLNAAVQGDETKARITIETEGTWLVQLMATQSGGPRPVAQVLITADDKPPNAPDERPVVGEDALDQKASPPDALFGLINAAREEQGLEPVRRSRKLDRVAQAHAQAMADMGRISHDTGAGDPNRRVAAAGLEPKAAGENVARGGSVVRLHRVLWNSPAHRENMLLRRWDEVGVAVVRDKNGALFATEIFIDSD